MRSFLRYLVPPTPMALSEDEVRTAAFFRWLNSGCQDGNDLGDWHIAERELLLRQSLDEHVSHFYATLMVALLLAPILHALHDNDS